MRRRPGAECQCVCTCLRRAARAVTQFYDEAFRPSGYRATQVSILAALAGTGPVTVSGLAEEAVTDRTTLTRNLKLLEKKGLICLEPGKDRRQRRVCLTKQGGRVLEKTHASWASAQEKVARKMGKEKLERMIADLSDVVDCCR